MSEPVLEGKLRRLTLAAAVLGLLLVAVAFLPGERWYVDANHCPMWEARPAGVPNCTPRFDELAGEKPAGGIALVVFVAAVLAPALLVRRDAIRIRAWFWCAWTALAGGGSLMLGFVLAASHVAPRSEVLWPTQVVQLGVAAFLALFWGVLPAVLLTTRKPSAG
jgi:hypothetical protein